MHKPQEALSALDKAEKLAKEEYDYDYYRAIIYICGFSDHHKALKCINKSLLKKQDSRSYALRGSILQYLGRYQESKIFLEKALEFSENNDQALEYLGQYYFYEKEYNKALIYIDRALLIQIHYNKLMLKGNILSALGRVAEAEMCYNKARNYEE